MIAIVIISLIAVASYGALRTALRVSAQHRESAVAETLLRSAAERLQDPGSPYVARAGCPGRPGYSDLPTADGYGPVDARIAFWEPPADVAADVLTTEFTAPGVCPATDPGLQAIELRVVTPSGFVHSLQIVKRVS